METSLREGLKASVLVLQDIEAVSHEAAKIFVSAANSSISLKGLFTVAVSGGSTPRRLFSLLGSNMHADKVDWSRIQIFWVDERCVPKDRDDSNFKGAMETLLSHIDIPEGNIHRIKGELPPEDGAEEYEKELKGFFGAGIPEFDLVFLGMGEDGHTASLFPGDDSLKVSERLAIPVYVERLKSWRVTMTLPVLNNSRRVVFLVTGKNKADVLKDMLENKNKEYPAGLIRPNNGSLTWLVDKDSAGEMESFSHR